MTPAELATALRSLFGLGRGWKGRAAVALRVDPATLWRYLEGESPIPGPVIAAVECWLERRNAPKP